MAAPRKQSFRNREVEEQAADEEVSFSVAKLSRDLKVAVGQMGRDEARFIVDTFYSMQENRIRAGNQGKALSKSGEPNGVVVWLQEQSEVLEGQMRKALDIYSMSTPDGQWLRGIVGIGPVLAAGFLAHLDIEKTIRTEDGPVLKAGESSAGAFWQFAGLNPAQKWEKGQKRPWNADLKLLCWKAGESFVKQRGRANCIYGRMYDSRRRHEDQRNRGGDYAERCRRDLRDFKFKTSTDAYKWRSGQYVPVSAEILPASSPGKFVVTLDVPRSIRDRENSGWNGNDTYMVLAEDILTVPAATASSDKHYEAVLDPKRSKYVKVLTFFDRAGVCPMLPPAAIFARSKRHAVRIFLSHLWHVMYVNRYGKEPPKPYVIAVKGHKDYIPPPNVPEVKS